MHPMIDSKDERDFENLSGEKVFVGSLCGSYDIYFFSLKKLRSREVNTPLWSLGLWMNEWTNRIKEILGQKKICQSV